METRHERQRIQMERRRHGAMLGWHRMAGELAPERDT